MYFLYSVRQYTEQMKSHCKIVEKKGNSFDITDLCCVAEPPVLTSLPMQKETAKVQIASEEKPVKYPSTNPFAQMLDEQNEDLPKDTQQETRKITTRPFNTDDFEF